MLAYWPCPQVLYVGALEFHIATNQLNYTMLAKYILSIRRVWLCLQGSVDTHYCKQREDI